MGGFAWVTLATNDSYSLGALVLGNSLRRVGSKHDLAVLITPGVTQPMREKLSAVFTLVQEVNVLDSQDEANLALLARPELGITFTKLHCWRLTQYEKCVFVDADTLVVRNCDELFEREELSAAPDVGWPDCFNSGVFVFKPSQQTFASLTAFAASQGSFDGGDQGLLNSFFSDWAHKDISKHLPFIYNMCSTATYSYLPAYKQFGENVRIIHFIGSTKPWLQYFDSVTSQVQPSPGSNHLTPLLQLWWNIFCESVHPQLSPVMSGIAGALARLTLGETRSQEQIALEEHMRKYSWEQGQIDYMGRDSFDNIWKKICTTLDAAPAEETPTKTPPKEKTPPVEKTKETSPVPTTKPVETTAEKEAAKEEDAGQSAPQPTKLPQADVETIKIEQPTTEQPKTTEKPAEVLRITAAPPLLPLTASPPVLSLTASPPILSIKEAGEKSQVKPPVPQQQPETVIPLGYVSTPTFESTTSLDLSAPIREPDNSVPIQVAESVLEADIKESVSEDIKPVTEEAIGSISAPIQESVSSVVETLEAAPPVQAPPTAQEPTPQANGTGGFDSDVKSDEDLPSSPPPAVQLEPVVLEPVVCPLPLEESPRSTEEGSDSQPTEVAEEATEVVGALEEASEPVLESQAPTTPVEEVKAVETGLTDVEKFEKPAISEDAKVEQIVPDVPEVAQSAEQVPEVPKAEEFPQKSPEPVKISLEQRSEESQQPEHPVPSTPTVTGPTPPTSPQFELSENQAEEPKPPKKTAKKLVKKSSSEDKTESSEADSESKKITKKVVKKVIKKPKEAQDDSANGSSSSTSAEKPKRVVKTVKKTTKPAESLEADTTVPETPPPPPSSDVPVPPKRKVKPGTTKTIKKPDSDQ